MYAIISQNPLNIEIKYDFDTQPEYIFWPDNTVSRFSEVGETNSGYTFVNRVVISDQPTSLHVVTGSMLSYDPATFTLTETTVWEVPPIDEVRDIAVARLTQWRNEKQNSGFTFGNVVYESDPLSRSSIEGAVSMALIANMSNTAYSVSWTALDNSQNVMDANTVIAFGVTAATSFQAWHANCLTLKNQVASANTAEDIQAVLDSVGA